MATKADEAEELPLVDKVATFRSEGRLLQELGERLVARPEVAVVELIKNAYDADSASCTVALANDNKGVEIIDAGTGMSESDFTGKWMRIATDSKSRKAESKLYKRSMTGEKGIGRFAARFIGKTLKLSSVAFDEKRRFKTRLEAFFQWNKVDEAKDLNSVAIPYKLWRVTDATPTGTTLTIGRLRIEPQDIARREIRDEILKIVSPVTGLDRGRFTPLGLGGRNGDPGFMVSLPPRVVDKDEEVDEDEKALVEAPANLAELVLGNYAGRVTANLRGKKLEIVATVPDWPKGKAVIRRKNFKHAIKSGFVVDIRYFPRRSGMFHGKEFNGRTAWSWIRKHAGVAIVDHGLRIRPYGYEDDDWLQQDADSASNRRQWRSSLMEEEYGILDSEASTNPMLALPQRRQVVGAVFVESEGRGQSGLIPASAREGYLENDAFDTVQMVTRAAIELLGLVDKRNQERLAKVEANRIAREAQGSFAAAIARIEASHTLSTPDKNRIVSEYKKLSENLTEAKDYARKAAFNLEAMSLLGVVAGFMTHESKRIFHLLTRSVATIKKLSGKHDELEKDLPALERSVSEFKNYLEYTSTFIDAMHGGGVETRFPVATQIEEVTARFARFAESRNIEVKIVADEDCMSPNISVAIYSGVILNLYTNALKALIGARLKDSKPLIEIRAWNDRSWHHVEVVDNGIGIPDDIKERIWDPLFTTTSNSFNPLGSGMGLGLSLVKRLVEAIGGRIALTEPPNGFSTCFHVKFKQKHED